MKHVKTLTIPKIAECNAVQALIVGKIAGDDGEYIYICQSKGTGKDS
jgi:hypothetical protein